MMLNIFPSNSNSDSIFNTNLVRTLVSANIPLAKINNEEFKNFLEK